MMSTGGSDRRLRANFRERQRINELNDVFQVLLEMLPPSQFEIRLSRVMILKDTIDYIRKLKSYLQNPADRNACEEFPHLFINTRVSNMKVSYRKRRRNKNKLTPRVIHYHHGTHTLSTTEILEDVPPPLPTFIDPFLISLHNSKVFNPYITVNKK